MWYKLGIDVGGTFTDFVLISEKGETLTHKTLSTPSDPSIGLLTGLRELAEENKIVFEELIGRIATIVHGTTVATNALLTLQGAKTALVTTRGFRDALEMRRGVREEQYNNHYRNITPLVPRFLRLTVNERIDAAGNIITPLNEQELLPVVDHIRRENIEAVAVCFMNAFKNALHEEKAVRFLRKALPSCFIVSSLEVLPSIRFYERVSTSAVSAYIGPVVANYLDKLTEKLDNCRFSAALLIMQSNGGVVTPEIVKKTPAVTVLSGPAGAPTASVHYANLLGYKNCITVDMGGTSFDAGLVIDNECVTSTDGAINRYRIALPSLDIITIGAGGGSIGWIDSGGLLQMGPQSAGALPGPVCYDRGGVLPTCTDADLVLGYLNPSFFAGGKIKLNRAKAEEAIRQGLAQKLDLSLIETAAGMYRIINSNMAQGVRKVTIERGHDPREFLFIVAGGAGPIHASEICRELEIPMFLVPEVSSVYCAAGMLLGDLKHDFIRSCLKTSSSIEKEQFLQLFNEMKAEGINTLKDEGVRESEIEFHPVLDMRYLGQYHEVQLHASWEDVVNVNLENIFHGFHKEHNRLFGYSLEEEATELELINARLRVIGKTEKPRIKKSGSRPVPLESALKETRSAYMPESGLMRKLPVYDGDKPLAGNTIQGPAIIEKITTSILVSENHDCMVDKLGSFVVFDRRAYPDGLSRKEIVPAGAAH